MSTTILHYSPRRIGARLLGGCSLALGVAMLPLAIVVAGSWLTRPGSAHYALSPILTQVGVLLAILGATLARSGRERTPRRCWLGLALNMAAWALCVLSHAYAFI